MGDAGATLVFAVEMVTAACRMRKKSEVVVPAGGGDRWTTLPRRGLALEDFCLQ
ncbi:MAG: hypothetical protein ACYSWQ_04410 [Planctomycetota bacterium]|jgi:hypothetical protein